MSFVKGQGSAHLHVLGRFASGFALSATLIFGLFVALGESASAFIPDNGGYYLLAVLLMTGLAVDGRDVARGATYSCLSCRRQAPADVARRSGTKNAAIAWGLDTGLGLTTFRVSSAYWIVVALALGGSAPWWIGMVYASGFLVPLAVGCAMALLISGPSPTVQVSRIIHRRIRAARIVGLAVLSVCSILSFLLLISA